MGCRASKFLVATAASLFAASPSIQGQILLPYSEDQDRLDQERTDPEVFGDEFSYRYPEHWQPLWGPTSTGFRTSVGSYDIDRFFVDEEARFFKANHSGSFELSLYTFKRETLIEQQSYRELRLTGRLLPRWYGSFFGYSGLDKKYGDLGGSIAFRGEQLSFEAFYISVDHYYNAKAGSSGDRYKRLPWSSGIISTFDVADVYKIRLKGYYNRPYRLFNATKGLTYENRRTVAEAQLLYRKFQARDPRLTVNFEGKEEHRTVHAPSEGQPKKEVLRRSTWESELAFIPKSFATDYVNFGIKNYTRRAKYQEYAPDQQSVVSWQETLLFADYYHKLNASHAWTYGVQGGVVSLKKRGKPNTDDYVQAKATLTYEYLIAQDSFLALTGTADLDELATKFPYRDGFPGWDGGNFKFVLTF